MKKISALLLTVVIMVTALTFTACGKVTIDLKEFTDIEFSGISGEGTVNIKFNHTAFMSKWFHAKGVKDPFGKETSELESKITAFDNSLNFTATPSEKLKNNDEITVEFTYNEGFAKSAGLELQNSSYSVTVEGLTEPIMVDAFDPSFFNTERGVMIQYNGIVPEGELEISNKVENSNPASKVSYYCKSKGVGYGEKVTITASLPLELSRQGYLLEKNSYEMPLSGFDHYMTDVAELDTEKTQLKGDLLDTVTAVATEGSHLRGNGRWGITNKLNYKFDSSYTSLSDVKLDDIYCLKEKDGCYKKVYVTMHGTVNTKETTYPITGLLELNDFIIAGDGSLKYKRDDIDYSFYADEDEAYDNVLKPQLKKYNIDKVTFE